MESDSELYSSLLFTNGKGYPLFQPQLSDNLPDEYKKTGIRIGDVGVVSRIGSFNPIFNILHGPGDHEINRFGVPENFVQLELGDYDIDRRDLCHPLGGHISNTKIKKRRGNVTAGVEDNIFLPVSAGAKIKVSTDSKRAAVLLLPDGASRWDLLALQAFKDYAANHTRNWYRFVNGRLGWMVANGDLYLVTGVTKSSSWHIAATEKDSGGIKLSLKAKAAALAAAGASGTWAWEDISSGGRHSGPRGSQALEIGGKNQTVFFRGFKTYFRLPRPAILPKALSIVDSEWSDVRWKGQLAPYSNSFSTGGGTVPSGSNAQNASSSPSDSADSPSDNVAASHSVTASRSGVDNAGGDRLPPPSDSADLPDDFVDSLDRVTTGYHPSRAINEHLLDCAPAATVAITHDDEWASILAEGEEEMPTRYELIRRISNKFEIDTTESGCVFLRPRGTGGERTSTEPLELESETLTPPSSQSNGKGTVFALIIGIDEACFSFLSWA
ncbi:hypothetical protein DFH06DRAFT_1224064 [Mycena polygramma]|nr:hypothetical protein DFH06DRAFT_1224064 [Mycena polygramma]